MSRFWEGDGEELFPNQYAFWQTNLERALNGRRGRRALEELRDALLHLPERRLISRALCTVNPVARGGGQTDLVNPRQATSVVDELVAEQGEGVCAVGAFAWWRNVRKGMTPEGAFDALPTLPDDEAGLDETAIVGREAGLAFPLAWHLAFLNDEEFVGLAPEDRYKAFMAWIDAKLAAGVVRAAVP